MNPVCEMNELIDQLNSHDGNNLGVKSAENDTWDLIDHNDNDEVLGDEMYPEEIISWIEDELREYK